MRRSWHPLLALVLPMVVLTVLRNAHASDPDWHLLTTPHFELYTDLDEPTAVEAAKELETTRDALITAAWPAFAFPDVVRTQVFVLSNGLDFERLFGRHLWGMFVAGTRPAFYLYGPPYKWAPRLSLLQTAPSSVLRHEMTHQLAAIVFRRAPLWFEEGLAQFLETIQITADGKSIVVGRTNRDGRASFYADRTVTLRRTLEWSEWVGDLPQNEVHGLYGSSWALFHWLYNNQQEAFSRYQLSLAKGINPKKAWDAAFPDFDPDAHERILYEYLVHGYGAVDTFPLRTSDPKIDIKALSAADGLAVHARIALTGARKFSDDARKTRVSDANAELKKALTLDPTSIEALLLASSKPSEQLLSAARSSAEAHPNDRRIHALVGDLLDDSEEREAAYRRALQIDYDDPQILHSLATLLIQLHRVDEAFPLALRAAKRAPHDYRVISTFAETLFQRGRCVDAVEQQQRAVDRTIEVESRAAPLVERLKVMKAECKASGALSERPSFESISNASEGLDAKDSGGAKAWSPPKIRPHDEGMYAGVTIGLGYGYGSYESTEQKALDSSFDGGGIELVGALGYAVTPGSC